MATMNGEMEPDVRVAVTHIDAYGRHVTVSTINRDSSVMGSFDRYAETIVFDNTTSPRNILDMGQAPEGSTITHYRLVSKWSSEVIPEDEY